MGNEPIFHIVSGKSIGEINAAVLVSYVKENKTWEGSDERLVEFWEYLSIKSSVEKKPNFTHSGILGVGWIDELLQESPLGDISALRNIF